MGQQYSEEKEYTIFCDESDRRGKYFSNFYGGVRVSASRLTSLENALNAEKIRLKITSEIKWSKVDQSCVDRYQKFVHLFFNEIEAGHAFMRVMFTQNSMVPVNLTRAQQAESYYILYYQFLKHGFGFSSIPQHAAPPRFRLYLDEIGDTREQIAKFRGFLSGLPLTKEIRAAGGIILDDTSIIEVRSHDHIIMQALDVILGSITFRLNDKHLEKIPGTKIRGKRTLAKEQLYKFILNEIKRVTGKKGFNIGISTALKNYPDGSWSDPYLHWRFVPYEHEYDRTATKP